MGSVAFTTLVVFLFATPGYLARKGYYSGVFTKATIPKNISDDLVIGALISLPFHMVGMGLVEHLHLNGYGPGFNFGFLIRLMTGDFGKDSSEILPLSNNLYEYIHRVALYFIAINIGAFAVGFAWRDLVWKKELDLKFPGVFEYRNRWLYTILGRGMIPKPSGHLILTFVDAIVELNQKTRLYRGIVYQFDTEENGQLRDIVLLRAQRGKFKLEEETDINAHGTPTLEESTDPIAETKVPKQKTTFYWEEIPGDYLVLKYAEIKNLNITYRSYSSPQSHAAKQTQVVNEEPVQDPSSPPP